MSRIYAKKKGRQKGAKVAKKSPSKSKGFGRVLPFMFKNVVIGAVFFSLMLYTATNVSGYNWFFANLIKGNLSFIKQNAKITVAQKKQYKLKAPYNYLEFVNQKSPDSAIVLFPFDSTHYTDKNFKIADFEKPRLTIMSKSYVSSLIYPRKAVFLRDKDSDPLFSQYTHVALVGGMGYELLDYKVRKAGKHSFMPRKLNKQ